MNREAAKEKIKELVERFKEHWEEYHHPDYKEANVRQDFINPMFRALGWDIDNEKGDSEAYREVIYEDKVVVKGKAKAPDYGFRLSGSGKKRLFYVEAKKPAVPLKTSKDSAYQLRRYGSSAQANVSILTNFEDFIVYDCSRVPNLHDSASVAKLKHIHFEKYLEEFDFIFDTFSHEAVTHGKFDKYVHSDTNKKGSQTLDKEFVGSLDDWRRYLAVSIAMNNRKLSDEEINFSVQQTIDRLIFLRFCEDRAVEPYGQLQKEVSKGNAYQNLFHLFKQADDKYNSGLFDFKKDTITPHLKVDSKVIKSVIEELYYPLCRYEFSVMPVEVLGNAYEQFLGKVIRITPARSVRIEEKPEVRKAGGVYYTPQYIVEYIVKNTVGKLVDGKSPKDIEKIKIVDPACGSGSFLLGAFEYILNYHINWYHHHPEEAKKAKALSPLPLGGVGGGLTTHEKKRILLNNIFGVDIDANAVEVTKLSLLLKCMEGETEASIKQQMSMFHERVLPDLDNNIKVGNSLVDLDFYEGFDFGEEKKVKPFFWEKGFQDVFKLGGFDAVIGNPPYVRIQSIIETSKESVEYFGKKYKTALSGNYDLYVLFVEKGLTLLKEKGLFGFILPNKFFNTDYGVGIRKLISESKSLKNIVDFEHHQVFEHATTYCCLLFLQNQKNINFSFSRSLPDPAALNNIKEETIEIDAIDSSPWNFYNQEDKSILDKLGKNTIELINLPCEISRGSSTGSDEIYVLKIQDKNKLVNKNNETVTIEEDLLKIPIYATDFNRYNFKDSNNLRIVFPYKISSKSTELIKEKELQVNYPKTYKYLLSKKLELNKRKQSGPWYGYSAQRSLHLHAKADILIPLLANKGLFTFLPDNKSKYTLMAGGGFSISILNKDIQKEYILGLLNSKLLFWYLNKLSNTFRGGWITCTKQYFSQLPIKLINQKDTSKKKTHNEIVENVSLLLSLNQELRDTRLQTEIDQIEQRIEHSEEKINELVYELYELTPEEIKIVDGKQ